MSISNRRLLAYAKRVIEFDDVREEVQKRIDEKMLQRFRTASPPEREVINAIMDNDMLFIAELRAIVAENAPINTEDNEVIKIER